VAARAVQSRRRMKTFLVLATLALVAACHPGGSNDPLSEGIQPQVGAQELMGCWQGYWGDHHVEYRFRPDGSVDDRMLPAGPTYHGRYSLADDLLTLDFGEEPPTFLVDVDATILTFVQFPLVFSKVGCTAE
jgi:hypothetical protein